MLAGVAGLLRARKWKYVRRKNNITKNKKSLDLLRILTLSLIQPNQGMKKMIYRSGANHPLFQDLTGQRFGRWLVVRQANHGEKNKGTRWWCRCDCAVEKVVGASSLKSGLSTSCGCYKAECTSINRWTHGATSRGQKLPEYQAWKRMRSRCRNKKSKDYRYYGGRGITVCERWLHSFEAFISDMGTRPSAKHSIDRIDNDKGYSPDNCRWATKKEQSNNRRSCVLLFVEGRTQTITGWAKEMGLSVTALWQRLDKGMSIEEALTRPLRICKTSRQSQVHEISQEK